MSNMGPFASYKKEQADKKATYDALAAAQAAKARGAAWRNKTKRPPQQPPQRTQPRKGHDP